MSSLSQPWRSQQTRPHFRPHQPSADSYPATMSIEKHGTKSIDLSHHLSELSKARAVSPLKGLMKYFAQPGILSLAGGLHISSFNLNITDLTWQVCLVLRISPSLIFLQTFWYQNHLLSLRLSRLPLCHGYGSYSVATMQPRRRLRLSLFPSTLPLKGMST